MEREVRRLISPILQQGERPDLSRGADMFG
jgi:hypothetical protein